LKLVVLGGSSIATPELILALAAHAPELPFRITLVGRDENKLALVGRACASFAERAPQLRVEWTTELGHALEGAQFILNQVRVGGLAARAFDESFPHQFNIPGEETVGPGGFANALRTVPVCVAMALEVERRAPDAWFLNLTNPAGIVQAALERTTNVRVVSICDSPVTLIERAAALAAQTPLEIKIDYLGMLHFGWIVRMTHDDQDLLARALEDIAQLPGFAADPRLVQAMGAIPSPYLNYFLAPDAMLAGQRAKGHARAKELQALEAQILHAYATANYVDVKKRAAAWYGKIIVPVLCALVQGGEGIVNARNGDALPWLPPDTIIETRCRINSQMISPEPAAPAPRDVKAMLQLYAGYESLVVDAILNDSYETAWRALRLNPLVASTAQARAILDLIWERRGFPPGTGQ
jgi:6-phospho-beta-glucosidase